MLSDEASICALAPDPASVKAARGLVAPAKWPLLGQDSRAVWGECQGSGAKPYQTQVDLSGPAFRCSCPSRKFPCKHGLALLLMRAQDAALFAASEAPAWVGEWLATRSEKAQKKEEKAAEKAAMPVDPQAAADRQAQREAQRWQRVTAAAAELQRWLADQLARGLGSLNPEVIKSWHTMAARLVDAQAPGLGQRVREAAQGLHAGEDWPERSLQRLGLLQLACEALARRETLSAELQADLRSLVGWPHDKAELQETGEKLADQWTVLGQLTEEREDKLSERRVWLQGAASGRRACLLDHVFAGKGFEQVWPTGAVLQATLVFFPGAAGLRALALDSQALEQAAHWPSATLAEEWQQLALRSARSPWLNLHPLLLSEALLLNRGEATLAVAGGQSLVLDLGEAERWRLLAVTGGQAVQLMGEWDGRRLRPLTAWAGQGAPVLWQRSLA
ncbi:hypothetical protein HNP55_003922 [Paucibacter oligotrophus]|uniref:SWIM-type domain-containing protein n=1 Tax=Roseateles oligotrophus TaxID=1769250 RepID=A0A840LFG3_9BURK|nr:SWIM zinc finger family protein [Roseateles oligotrophus]MBB4845372.1 hypothetical protein [Roseateles oligotrophus]